MPTRTSVETKPSVLHEFFEQAATRWPDAVAVDVPPSTSRPRTVVTYAELRQRSHLLAATIARIARPASIAAILLPRTTEQLYAAQLAVLRARMAYVCLEPAFPDEQLRHILADADARVVLTDASGEERLRINGYSGEILRVDTALPTMAGNPVDAAEPDSLAYLIYTSGTTGSPKGVMITHRGIANLVRSDLAEFGLEPGDRVAQGSSPAYDSSVEEVWLALSSGATVVVLDDDTVRSGPDLVRWLRTERVTVLCPPPTLLRATGCTDPRTELPQLRLLYVGGEALPDDVAALWAPGRRLVNGYGPTECTVTCLRSDVVAGQPIAIGRPVPGMRAWVLDDDLQPVAPGRPGELCLAGAGLALGYRSQPELTAAKFPTHPRLGRIYRTGDLVHAAPDGTIFYHGRIDSQVKLRGYRIELEAIESCLAQCAGVREAACRVEGEGPGQLLSAHLVPVDPARPPDQAELVSRLRLALPVYMVPALFGVLDDLPRSPSGKLRRDALPELAATVVQARTPQGRLPTEALERAIEEKLRRVLPHLDAVGVDDDFFTDLGGSSLQAAMLVTELRGDPATAGINVRDVYEARSVGALARRCRSAEPGPVHTPAAMSTVNPAAATIFQASWIGVELVVASTLAYLVIFDLGPWAAQRVGLVALLMLLPVIAAVASPLVTPLLVGFAVLAKLVLIGRFRPARVPAWSGRYVRIWVLRQFVGVVPWSRIAGTEFQCIALRALGARIGQRVHIHPGVDLAAGGWDLLDIGDDVTIGQDASLRLVELSEGHVVIGPVALDSGATVEVRAGVGQHSRLGRNSVLSALSSLPDGTRTGDDEVWDGVPARRVRRAPEVPFVTRTGRELSPVAHGLATLASRSLLDLVQTLPFSVATVAFVAWSGITYEYVLTVLAHPLAHAAALAATAALVCLSTVVAVAMEALAARCLGTVRESVISRWGLAYLRIGLKAELVESAGRWLSGGLYWPVWLRWAGMKVGRGCEISTIIDVVPELVEIRAGTFLADGIYLGGPRVRRGMVRPARVVIGSGSFFGNHAVVPGGHFIPNGVLIGVCTVADDRVMAAGTSWFGHPAFELPRREIVDSDPALTHEPPFIRVVNRLFWEWLRFALPVVPLVALAGWVAGANAAAKIFSTPVLLALAIPVLSGVVAALDCALVLALKWTLLGRVRPGIHPLWSCWCSRWDFLYVAWGFLAGPLLSAFEETLMLAIFLRAAGMRIGRRVLLCDGFAQVVDPDMIRIDDGATVNAMFQAHTFEDRVLKIDEIRVRAGATMADATVPLYGADIGEATYVAPHSVAMKREQLLPGQRYEGVPTAPCS